MRKRTYLFTVLMILFLTSTMVLAGNKKVVEIEEVFYHKIIKGDTLCSLSRNYKVNLADLYLLNKLKKDSVLSVGDYIMIPIYKLRPVYWAKASWYGDPHKKLDNFHGKKMANGQPMNTYELVAAHKEYPLGTVLRVTNPQNNKTIIVRVVDRGPYVKGRELDLSWAAAYKLSFLKKGTGYVHIVPVKVNYHASLR